MTHERRRESNIGPGKQAEQYRKGNRTALAYTRDPHGKDEDTTHVRRRDEDVEPAQPVCSETRHEATDETTPTVRDKECTPQTGSPPTWSR